MSGKIQSYINNYDFQSIKAEQYAQKMQKDTHKSNEEEMYFGTDATVNTKITDLNVRSGPGTSTEVIDSLPKGTMIKVIDDNINDENGDKWVRVEYGDGKMGYVSRAYIEENPDRVSKSTNSQEHIVQSGDTLWGIASKQLGPNASNEEIAQYVNKLANYNNIDNPNLINVGQEIKIPLSSEGPSPTQINREDATKIAGKVQNNVSNIREPNWQGIKNAVKDTLEANKPVDNSVVENFDTAANWEEEFNSRKAIAEANNIKLTNEAIIDAINYGTFENGYQPKGMEGRGNFKIVEGLTINNNGSNKNVYQADDGSRWYWNDNEGDYAPYTE